jgi:hypothetical protein
MTSGEHKLNELLKDDDRFNFLKEYCRQNGLNQDDENDLAKATRAWNAGRKMSIKDVKDNTPDSIGGDNKPADFKDFIRKSIQSQYAEPKQMMGGEHFNIDSVGASVLKGLTNPLAAAKDLLKDMGEQAVLYLRQQTDLLEKVGQKTGILGDLSEGFRTEISKASEEAIRVGVSFTELSDVITDVVAESGKFKLLDEKTMSDMALVSKFSKDLSTYARLIPIFEKIGLGVGDMNREIEKAGRDSMALGLNARTIVTMIGENLDKLNTYGFKNGVQGMKEMAQRAVEFRMDMNKAFVLADKVWSPDGALDVVANLQVIGGAFGDLNDPIKLMYMATNNVEGLQTAIQGAAKSLVTFNQEQGRFEVTGANLRRAKEMADQFGMSVQELTTAGVAGMERMQASTELAGNALKLDPKQTEFITNLARMEGGKMVISIPENLRTQLGMDKKQENIALENIDQAMAERLIAEQDKLKDKSMKEIAVDQVSIMENINRSIDYLVAIARVEAGSTIRGLAEKYLKFNPEKIQKEIFTAMDTIGPAMKGGIGKMSSAMLGKENANQTGKLEGSATTQVVNNTKKETAATTAATPEPIAEQTIHHKIEIITKENAFDPIKRMWLGDPGFCAATGKSYLATIGKK